MEKYYYDAFISYRHKKLDSFVAENIHKMLEHYHIPRHIQKSSGKKKIERIFRDVEELPISSDLAENIKQALDKSEYLIVVCSPDAVESKWVLQEIEYFLENHKRDNVLAVISSGEPDEAFPKILLYDEVEITDKKGKKRIVSKQVEPLAADVRGSSKKEVAKKIKTEGLRLIAALLKCKYDDLKQRQKEYLLKRRMAAAVSISVAALAFTVYSLYQSAKVNEQYKKALIEESKYLSEVSKDLLKKGFRKEAIKTAMDALPKEDDYERPLVQEAVHALNNSLYSYSSGDGLNYKPHDSIEYEIELNNISSFENSDQYYMVIDKVGTVIFHSFKDNLPVWKIKAEDLDFSDGENVFKKGEFLSDTLAAIVSNNKVVVVDVKNQEVKYIKEAEGYTNFSSEIVSNAKYFAVINDKECIIYESLTGEEKNRINLGEDSYSNLICMDSESDCLAIKNKEYLDEGYKYSTIIVDIESGTKKIIENKDFVIEQVKFLDNKRIVLAEQNKESLSSDDSINRIRVFDLGNNSDEWVSKEYEMHSVSQSILLNSFNMTGEDGKHNVITFAFDNMFAICDEDTGEYYVEKSYSDRIINVIQHDEKRLLVGTADGTVYIRPLVNMAFPIEAARIDNDVSYFEFNKEYECIYQFLRFDNKVVLSNITEDGDMKKMNVKEEIDYVSKLPLYGDERKECIVFEIKDTNDLLVKTGNSSENLKKIQPEESDKNEYSLYNAAEKGVYLYEKNGNIQLKYPEKNTGFKILKTHHTDDKEKFIALIQDGKKIELKYWNVNSEKWEKYNLTDEDLSKYDINKNISFCTEKNYIAFSDGNNILIIDMVSGEQVKSIPFSAYGSAAFEFTKDGEHIILYGDNKKIVLWNIEKEKSVAEYSENIEFSKDIQIDNEEKFFVINEGAGYTEVGIIHGGIYIYTLDIDDEKFYPYAYVKKGWFDFENNEIGCIGYEDLYGSPVKSFETLRKNALKILNK